ncbi:regulator of chromosome condensation 1/beta-lactamase-inhibitor protein II [Leucosporidium creatinivorum]|uniref:Regulator of chromosome condensation 1/beta-lactamase-inhibitor protein II n=1 Tax=Leucosporidium creatinivorum TaxID=106004 RepID=A0A1Y2FZY3_9BASI|nr:regulator of chromosome condensation 1/beta-lactamase-inhibitor protein II [Leucosporidium creatinivorum]
MARVFACGDNSFGNVLPNKSDLHLFKPVELPDVSSIAAASWSQTIVRKSESSLKLQGLADSSLDLSAARWLGQNSFVAWLRSDGRVESVEGTLSDSTFSHIAMNGRGELLGVSAASPPTITFYSSMKSLLTRSPEIPPIALKSPLLTPPTSVDSLIAGASHFLLLLSAPSHAILSYGDNRFSQLGVPSSTSSPPSKLHHVDFFEGLAPKRIAAGAFHSTVVGGDGALYVFGKGSEGQCGGEGGGEPALIELGDGEEEVVSVGCGSGHTVVVTDRGVWVTGANDAGQLGLGDKAPRPSFTRNEALSSLIGSTSTVTCTPWNTFLNL